MRSSRLVVGLVLALLGVLWLAQGVGIISGSAMSGSGLWAVIGAVLLVVAAAILAMEVRRPSAR
jgi:biotin transporter BioY